MKAIARATSAPAPAAKVVGCKAMGRLVREKLEGAET